MARRRREENAGAPAVRRRDGSFDAYDLVRRGGSLSGRFDATTLPRTVDRVAADGGPAQVSWRISGITDPSGRPALEVRIDGTVPPGYETVRCLVRLKGDATPAQLKEIHESVRRTSPNYFTLASPVRIETELLVE